MIEVRDYLVYQIVDPRDELPFYVGYTADIQARMRQHLAGDNSNDAKSKRIAELQALGLAPSFKNLRPLRER